MTALREAPWTGYGWLQAGAAQYTVADQFPPMTELFLHAHNLFLELAVWCGYPLGILLIAFVVYWFASRLRRTVTLEGCCGLLIVVLLGIHSMLELPYHYAYFLIPAGIWIGIVDGSIGAQSKFQFRAALGLGVTSFVLCIGVCRDYLAVESDFELARFEYMRVGTLHPISPMSSCSLLSNLTTYTKYLRRNPNEPASQAVLREMGAITERYPYSDALFRYALTLAANGDAAGAAEVFNKIRHVHGEEKYRDLRQKVHQRVLDGETKLLHLDQVLL